MRAHSIAIPGLLAVGIAAGPTMVGAQTTPILVPMFVKCNSASMGRKPAKVATNNPTRIVLFQGVRKRG